MKLQEVQLKDMSALAGLPGATSWLTVEHEPELLDNGWVRFKDKNGNWHRIPPDLIRRVSEVASKPVVAQDAQQATRGPGRPPRVPGT